MARVLERVIERKGDQKVIDVPKGVDVRLEKLRAFQIAALRKAMSFPAVRNVVYSTCSIHQEENESVVTEVLSGSSENSLNLDLESDNSRIHNPLSATWTLVEPVSLKDWKRRGQVSNMLIHYYYHSCYYQYNTDILNNHGLYLCYYEFLYAYH